MAEQKRCAVRRPSSAAFLESGRFVPLRATAGPVRSFATATPLPGGDVLVVGGYDERIRVHRDALLLSRRQIYRVAR